MNKAPQNILFRTLFLLSIGISGLLCSFNAGAQTVRWYQDIDADGWGNPAVTTTATSQPTGYVLNNLDCNDNNANSTAWSNTGSTGFSQYGATYTAIAVDAAGIPYVAYNDNTTKGSVQKYSGGAWSYVGTQHFTAGQAEFVSLAINSSGQLYMAYRDNGYKASVMRYNGSSWVNVGSAQFTLGGATYTSLVLDAASTPYVAFRDDYYLYPNKATVMKYNGSSWVAVGSPGFTSGTVTYTSLAIDGSGTLYLAFSDNANSDKATVMKFNGSSWVTVGSAGFSAGAATYVSLALDPAGNPYVAYRDAGNSNKATVRKYNGSSWVTVGSAGFSAGTANDVSLVVDSAQTPYVAYSDAANSNKATVMKYNGSSWVNVVSAGITSGAATYTNITLSKYGVPYVAYQDGASSNKASAINLSPVINYPSIPVAAVTPSVTCSSGSVTLSLTGTLNDATSWKWYSGSCGGTYVGSGTSLFTSLSATTTYYVRGENGCASSDGLCGFVTATLRTPIAWYQDSDGDGWGNPAVTTTSCTAPASYVENSLDCNDAVVTSSLFYMLSSAAINTNNNSWSSIAIDNTNTPYIAFYESFSKGSVMKYNSGSWSYVGSPQFTAGATQYNSLAIDASGTPYMAYQDAYSGASVMKYDGSSWVNVGSTNFSSAGASYTSLAIDPSGTPYVAYKDAYYMHTDRATVMKYNGSSWVAVGTPGFSAGAANYTSLAIDGGGTPYVAYSDGANSNKVSVMKYTGSAWVQVGAAGFSAGAASYVSLAIDNSGIPYVAYKDGGNSNKATVMKFNGTSWVNLGSAGFTPGTADYTSLAIDHSNIPYIVFSNGASSNKATVMKYNGSSWAVYGNSGYSAGTATYTSIAIDAYGIPVTAFQDAGSSSRIFGMKAGPNTTAPTTPSVSVSVNPVGCGSPTVLTATGTLNGAGNWYWYSGSCGGTFVGTGSSFTVTPTASTTYYARGDGGCLTTPGFCNSVTVTVIAGPPTVASITGPTDVCEDGTVTLSNTTPGGVWSSSNTSRATVNSSGVVTGVSSSGSVSIRYTVTNACGTTQVSQAMNVLNGAGPITGTLSICEGSTTSLDGSSSGTWVSSNTAVGTITSSSGNATGLSPGTTSITYTRSSTGCTATVVLTVNEAPAAISGSAFACLGSTITLTNAVAGGTWTSSNTSNATVGSSTGIVTSVSTGTSNITYTLPGGCYETHEVDVVNGPAAITGDLTVCVGTTSGLSSSGAGPWTSSNTGVATVSGSGTVTGVAAGTSVITHTVTATGCFVTAIVTINTSPAAITGSTIVCMGTTITLSNAVSGGTWSSSTTSNATIGSATGIVSTVSTGTSTISYILSNGCFDTHVVDVQNNPSAITGTRVVCDGATTTLASGGSGTWSSSNTAIATVGTSGIVTGVDGGTATITFTLASSGCFVTAIVTVNPVATIGGSTRVCLGTTTTLTTTISGGTWLSSTTSRATIGSSSGLVTPVSAGTTRISYTLPTGCRTTTIVTVANAPSVTSVANSGPICAGVTLTLSSSGPSNVAGYLWTGPVSITSATSASATVPSASTAATGVYSLTVNNGTGAGCSRTYTTSATVNALPSAAPTNNGPKCGAGASVTLSANPAGGATVYAWSGPNLSSSTVQNPTATPTVTATYSLTVSNGSGLAGCSPSTVYTTTVTVNSLPTAAPTNNGPICGGGTVTLTANPGGSTNTYLWSGPNLSSATAQNPTATPTVTAVYSLTVSFGSGLPGCTSSIYTTTVTVTAGSSWLGTVSTDWYTSGNWCGGIPTTATAVLIPNGTTYYPLITTGTASANNLTIQSSASVTVTGGTLAISGAISNSGTFTASAGGTIEMNGSTAQTIPSSVFAGNTINNLTINNTAGVTLSDTLKIKGILTPAAGTFATGGYITLLSTSSQTALISGSGSGSLTGNVTMQRYLPQGYGYKYISSPFTGASVSGLSSYIDLGATFPRLYGYNESLSTAGWVNYTADTNTLYPLKGYSANFGTSTAPVTFSLRGVVNSGTLSSTIYNNNNTYTLGFNLAGNPYPSPIDWTAASGWTKTNIDNAIYYFNSSDTNQYTGTYSSYIAGVSSDGVASNIIPAMQGFFVHVSNGSYPVTGTLGTNNNVRVNSLSPYYHRVTAGADLPLIRLEALFPGNTANPDPTVIYLNDQASDNFNNETDALKLLNTSVAVPNLYSWSGDEKKMSIKALHLLPDTNNIVPLGLQTEVDGQVIFNARNIDNMPDGVHVYFYDIHAGKMQSLQTQPQYTTYLSKGKYENRFYLMLSNKDIKDLPILNNELNAYTSGQSLFVYLLSDKADIVITNMLGQVLHREELTGTGYHEIEMKVSAGLYIATLYSGHGKQSKKVFIGKE